MGGNFADPGRGRRSGWNKIQNPGTGWLEQKTTFTADRFVEADGGFEVDFTPDLPIGVHARAVMAYLESLTAGGIVFARAKGDPSISNTPNASSEWSTILCRLAASEGLLVMIPLDADNKCELAVSSATQDINVAHAAWYLA